MGGIVVTLNDDNEFTSLTANGSWLEASKTLEGKTALTWVPVIIFVTEEASLWTESEPIK